MNDVQQAVWATRFLSADAVEQANSGHPGTPMGLADIGVELFTRHLRYNPEDPLWPNRDRFVLSCGHASALLYSLLHLAGYDLSIDDLRSFRQWGSRTPGHPELGHTPGVETTTGPLGQGVANAVGMALAGKMMAARLGQSASQLVDYRVYVLASDGDLMEGVAREAISFAGHLGLDNLIVIYDDNRITIDGGTELSLSDDMGRLFQASGWQVWHVDGHACEEVRSALDQAKAQRQAPCLLVARTHIGYGAPNKQDTSSSHGAPLGKTELELTKTAAGWPLSPSFHVPEAAYLPFRAKVRDNQGIYQEWQRDFAAMSPQTRALWDSYLERPLPDGLLSDLIDAAAGKADATRKLSKVVQQRLAEATPALVGGSADLAASALTSIAGGGDVARGSFAGRNLHFGIREHAMAAIANGLSTSGWFVPFGSTFLIFSDYMRPSIRLSALMRRQVVYVFTHDSVMLGEDGPTHQPIEQLSALRLIPNLHVFRPADGMECAAAWFSAAQRNDGPTAIVLSRQSLPILPRPEGFDPRAMLAGAYVVSDTARPELVLMATGSEVSLAVELSDKLAQAGHPVRVVSIPCLELMLAQPEANREALLPRGVPRVALELGVTALWKGIVGDDGMVVGIDHYGASAPAKRLKAEFGMTAEALFERVQARFWPKRA